MATAYEELKSGKKRGTPIFRILGLFILLLISFLLVAGVCATLKIGAPKIYGVKATTQEGLSLLSEDQMGVRYLCKNVYSIYWGDFLRRNCFFGAYVEYTGDEVKYLRINDDAANQLGLEPDFTTWDRFGWLASVGLIFLAVLGWFLLAGSGIAVTPELS